MLKGSFVMKSEFITLGKIHRAQNCPDIFRELPCRDLVSYTESDMEVTVDVQGSGMVLKSPNNLPWHSVWKILNREISDLEICNLQCNICLEGDVVHLYVFFPS